MIAGIALTLVSLWVGQNHGLMPVAASETAPLVDGLFNTMMTISVALFILIQGALVISVFKFRKPEGDETDAEPIEGNLSLEILWTAIPVFIVIGLSLYSYEVYNTMGGLDPMASHDHGTKMAMKSGAAIAAPLPGSPEAEALTDREKVALGVGASPESQDNPADVEVDVMGLQFAWIFTYPETGVVAYKLHIPAGKEVQLNIEAQDVLHAFWVPQFRLKQDAIPGRTSELRFTANLPGTYPVVCAELCGSYHGGMQTEVIIQTPEEYDEWMEEEIALLEEEMEEYDMEEYDMEEDDMALRDRKNLAETLAMKPADKSASEFLNPYTSDLGITSETLAQLHSQMNH